MSDFEDEFLEYSEYGVEGSEEEFEDEYDGDVDLWKQFWLRGRQ
jgi:hypothetical protein